MRAMRDTAVRIFELAGLAENQKARAAYMAASLSQGLGEIEACATWAARAKDRVPTNQSYIRMVNSCQ